MTAAKYSRYYTYIKPVVENKIIKSVTPYIFSLITMSILIFFAIRPTISTILNLQKEIENNQQILADLESKTNSLIQGKSNLDNLNEEVKTKINTAIPKQTTVPALIRNLQNSSLNYASISALQIQPLTIIDHATEAQSTLLSLGEINFSYNIQGSFGQLLGALQNLSNSPRLIKINNLVINKQTEGITVLSVSGKAFYLK